MRCTLLVLSAASTRELAIAPHALLRSPVHRRTGRIHLVEGEKPRPKKNAFGARLDADIVGEDVLASKADAEEHEALLRQGVREMQAGKYVAAVTSFTQAVAAVPGGLTSREGGQYSVWLAQALQGAGRKKEAARLLQRCDAHPDKDVRKIANNMLYIMQARRDRAEIAPRSRRDSNRRASRRRRS